MHRLYSQTQCNIDKGRIATFKQFELNLVSYKCVLGILGQDSSIEIVYFYTCKLA
jgi:hypothetical protein